MPTYSSISFLTDYGLEDGFVAACHGVLARTAPEARVLDVSHLVPPGDVRRGAMVLAQTVRYLPPSVHLAVVDPGVGTARRAVALEAGDGILVGPDNGLLVWAAEVLGGPRRVHVLENASLWVQPVASTFHGRDLFAPVAGHLARGLDLAQVGPPLDPAQLVRLPQPVTRMTDGVLEAEVTTIDRFGNVQLAAPATVMPELRLALGDTMVVEHGGTEVVGTYGETFGSVPPGELLLHHDSSGLLGLALNGGSAAARLGVRPGMLVRLRVPAAESLADAPVPTEPEDG